MKMLPPICAAALLPFTAAGSVILNEAFALDQLTTQDLPATSAWYASHIGDLSQPADGTLALDTTGGTRHLLTYFTDAGSYEIAIGSFLQVSYEFRLDTAPAVGGGLRVGLYNTNANDDRVTDPEASTGTSSPNFEGMTGYVVYSNPASSSYTMRARDKAGEQFMHSGTPITTLEGHTASGLGALTAGVTYTGVLNISRTGADAVTFSHTLTGPSFDGSISIDIEEDAFVSFNTFGIAMLGGDGRLTGIELDSVTIIPEPSTYALLFGVLGMAWVLIRRRRR